MDTSSMWRMLRYHLVCIVVLAFRAASAQDDFRGKSSCIPHGHHTHSHHSLTSNILYLATAFARHFAAFDALPGSAARANRLRYCGVASYRREPKG